MPSHPAPPKKLQFTYLAYIATGLIAHALAAHVLNDPALPNYLLDTELMRLVSLDRDLNLSQLFASLYGLIGSIVLPLVTYRLTVFQEDPGWLDSGLDGIRSIAPAKRWIFLFLCLLSLPISVRLCLPGDLLGAGNFAAAKLTSNTTSAVFFLKIIPSIASSVLVTLSILIIKKERIKNDRINKR